jgi:hypothetical protein
VVYLALAAGHIMFALNEDIALPANVGTCLLVGT